METTKTCSKCNTTKDISQFTFRKDTQKYRNECKECKSLQDKEIYNKKREKILQNKKNHRLLNIEKYKEKDRIYYIKNCNLIKEKRKEYVKANLDKIKKYRKRKDVLLRDRNNKHKRRTSVRDGDVTIKQIEELIEKSTYCYWCNVKLKKDYHLDHYTPISKGGKHTISNLVVSCPSCNLQKHAKDPYQFALEKGRLL